MSALMERSGRTGWLMTSVRRGPCCCAASAGEGLPVPTHAASRVLTCRFSTSSLIAVIAGGMSLLARPAPPLPLLLCSSSRAGQSLSSLVTAGAQPRDGQV
jgi:hypothetical protein